MCDFWYISSGHWQHHAQFQGVTGKANIRTVRSKAGHRLKLISAGKRILADSSRSISRKLEGIAHIKRLVGRRRRKRRGFDFELSVLYKTVWPVPSARYKGDNTSGTDTDCTAGSEVPKLPIQYPYCG